MKKYIIYLVVFYLIIDVCYTFLQSSTQSIDGDVSDIVAPSESASYVLKDPFGYKAIIKNEFYNGPNRFFIHYSMFHYFRNVPLLLQNFFTPIDSIYISQALFTTLTLLIMVFLISSIITSFIWKENSIFSIPKIIVMGIVFPLVHINGYNKVMGLSDTSITYTFFYSYSIISIILLFMPIVYSYNNNSLLVSFKKKHFLLMIPLTIICAFNGPLIPPSVIIISLLLLTYFIFKIWQKATTLKSMLPLILFLTFSIILCIYSFYIGRFNSDNSWATIPILERYLRLPIGLFGLLTNRIGLSLLVFFIGFNFYILNKKIKNFELNILFKWAIIFSLIYLLLLPLGGYREYRPNIIRTDTALPIFILVFILFGLSTIKIILNIDNRNKYLFLVIAFLSLNIIADSINFDNNKCEKESLKIIAASKDSIVRIQNDCNIMEWKKTIQPEDSKLNGELLFYWGITPNKKLYFQE